MNPGLCAFTEQGPIKNSVGVHLRRFYVLQSKKKQMSVLMEA